MANIAFIYSTVDGHALEICECLQRVVECEGHQSSMYELTVDSKIDLEPFDRIVIGASVRYGKHRPEVARFIEQNTGALEATPNARVSARRFWRYFLEN